MKNFSKTFLINAVILISLNVISYYTSGFIDLSADKRYSLSPTTKQIVKEFDDKITIEVFLSSGSTPNFRKLFIATQALLNQYQDLNARIQLQYTNPFLDKKISEQAEITEKLLAEGLDLITLSTLKNGQKKQDLIFPGALIRYRNQQIPVNFVDTQIKNINGDTTELIEQSLETLEFKFTNALLQLSSTNKAFVGFTMGHAELSDLELKDITHHLSKYYHLLRVDLSKIKLSDLLKLKTLVIPGPLVAFTELEKYKIDQFLMHGHGIMLLTSNNNASNGSLFNAHGSLISQPLDLNLDDLFFKYGFKINYNIVQDLICSPISVITGFNAQNGIQDTLPWVYYPLLNANASHVISKKLGPIRSEYVSSISLLKNTKAQKTILLTSSNYSREINLPALVSLEVLGQKAREEDFNSDPKVIGVLIEGELNSAFVNRSNIFDDPTGLDTEFRNCTYKGQLIAAGTKAIIRNDISSEHEIYPLGFDKYSKITYNNKEFITNSIHYLSGNQNLLSLRAKSIKLKILDQQKIASKRLNVQVLNTTVPIILSVATFLFFTIVRKFKLRKL